MLQQTLFSKYRAFLFDLDGTLIQSNHVWAKIDGIFLGKRGFAVPENYFREVSALNFNQAAEYTITRFGLNETPEQVVAEWFELVIHEYRHTIMLKNGAGEFLRAAKNAGMKIALATAAAPELYEAVLQNNGVYECFDAFACTGEVPRGKGFPDVYELAAKRLGIPPQDCLVFEDIPEGISGAKAGGFACLAVLDHHSKEFWDMLKAEANYAITDFTELLTEA